MRLGAYQRALKPGSLAARPYGAETISELRSKPFAPHPLFSGFIRAALQARDKSQAL